MTQAQQNRRMSDDEMGQAARALLNTLSSTTTDEGRLAAVMRTLWQVESMTLTAARADAGPQLNTLPAWEELDSTPDPTFSNQTPKPAEVRLLDPAVSTPVHNAWTTKPMHEQASLVRGMSTRDIERLIASSPGPLTEYLRRVTSVAANALLACQFGSFSDAPPMLRWCVHALLAMRQRWSSAANTHPLYVSSALALTAASGAELGHTTVAAGAIRRFTANLAAMARAAARLEGTPEADPDFAGPEPLLSTIVGLDRQTATFSAKDIALALELNLECVRPR